jgi:hypothetical protein
MGITRNDIQTMPTCVGGGCANTAQLGNPDVDDGHHVFDATKARVRLRPAHPGRPGSLTELQRTMIWLNPIADPNGDTIFLLWAEQQITSLVLPTPREAERMGINTFLTSDLTSCKMFIDKARVGGNDQFILYHANAARDFTLDGDAVGEKPDYLNPDCEDRLDNQHSNAQKYYTKRHYHPENVAQLARPRYNRGAQHEVMRKRRQRRSGVKWVGKTMVCGILEGGDWEFYFQTSGGCDYHRPWNAPKRLIKGKQHEPDRSDDHKIVEQRCFYR